MTYTPRQIAAFVELTSKIRMREAAEKLSLTATAMHGTSQVINKRIKDLTR